MPRGLDDESDIVFSSYQVVKNGPHKIAFVARVYLSGQLTEINTEFNMLDSSGVDGINGVSIGSTCVIVKW